MTNILPQLSADYQTVAVRRAEDAEALVAAMAQDADERTRSLLAIIAEQRAMIAKARGDLKTATATHVNQAAVIQELHRSRRILAADLCAVAELLRALAQGDATPATIAGAAQVIGRITATAAEVR